MIAVAIALIVVGLVIGLLVPPFGFLFAIPGLILFVLFIAGFGRRAAARDEHRF